MKKLTLVALFSAVFSTTANADAWAFDSEDKIASASIGAVYVEVAEKTPSWTFCERDSVYLAKDYESHSFN